MSTMQHSEFITGERFWSNEKWWRCTDFGKRVIVAIALDHDHDPSCRRSQSSGLVLANGADSCSN